MKADKMSIYLIAGILVCMVQFAGAQYYGTRPPSSYSRHQNSEAWRQWYYRQQRHQQQRYRERPSRGRPGATVASPAANYYPSRYPSQQYGSSQQYYQQRQYPQQQYSSYRQSGYRDYRQPNYQPPPPPVTPPPPTTPPEKNAASTGKTSSGSLVDQTSTLVSTAARIYPDMQSYSRYGGSNYQGVSSLYRNPAYSYRRRGQAPYMGQSPGSNVGLNLSPAVIKAVQLLIRYNQHRAHPAAAYQKQGSFSKSPYYGRETFANPYSSGYKRRKVPYTYQNTRMLPRLRQGLNAKSEAITRALKNIATTAAPTTTPGVRITTEWELIEGITTTSTIRPSTRLRAPYLGGPLSASAPVIPQQSYNYNHKTAPQQSYSYNHKTAPQQSYRYNHKTAPQQSYSYSHKTAPQQSYNYNYPPYQTSNSAPPGFISMDQFRAEIMSTIQFLTNEISGMTSNGSATSASGGANFLIGQNTVTATPSTKKVSASSSRPVRTNKLASLPGHLSFLLGKFASKLPSKSPSASSFQLFQSSQNVNSPSYATSQSQAVPQSPAAPPSPAASQSPAAPQSKVPNSEWSGLLDLTPQQIQQLKQGTWVPSPAQQQQLQQQQQQQLQQQQQPVTIPPQPVQSSLQLEQTTQPPAQQNLQQNNQPPVEPVQQQPPPQEVVGSPHSSSWHNPPPLPPQDPYARDPYQSQQLNQSGLYEPQQNPPHQPPPLEPPPHRVPHHQVEPQPLDIQQQPPWNPPQPLDIQQQPPWNPPQPLDIQQQPPWNQPQPLDIQQQPPWNQPQPYEYHQPQQQNQQTQAPLDFQWQQQPPPPEVPRQQPHDVLTQPPAGSSCCGPPHHSRRHPRPGSYMSQEYHHPQHYEPPPHHHPPPYDLTQGPASQYEPQLLDMPPSPQPYHQPPPEPQPPQPQQPLEPQPPQPQQPLEPQPPQPQQPLEPQPPQPQPPHLMSHHHHYQEPPPLDMPPPQQAPAYQSSHPHQSQAPPTYDYYPGQQFNQSPPPEPHYNPYEPPQRPPPLDISNYRPPGSHTRPPPPQPEYVPPNQGPSYNVLAYEQTPWNQPTDPGGQGYGSSGYYGNQYHQEPSPAYSGGHYQQSGHQPAQQSSSYYQQSPGQPTAPQQQQQPGQGPSPTQQQQPYGQSSFNQSPPQQQGTFGSQQPPPADAFDPYASRYDMNALKPTVFNPNYQSSSQSQTQSQSGSGLSFPPANPSAPPGKLDFGSRGPNPIQLNQFLAQPVPPKDTNALESLLGTLLSGTVAAQTGQQSTFRPRLVTTRAPTPPPSGLISDRLDGFVLGPKSEYRSNTFSEIPVNGAAYDTLNPLAGFMGETPPPPATTTPLPPGRNGDFLEGFIGVSKQIQPSKPAAAENLPPNIYFYNYMNDNVPVTTPAPAPPPPAIPALNDQTLNNLGTQDLSSMVQTLLGVLARKQGTGQG